MNDHDPTGLEVDLQKLKPAAPPPAFIARLVVAAQPGRTKSASRPVCPTGPTRPTLMELCWPFLRWLLPSAAAAGLVLLLLSRSASTPPAPAGPQASQAPLKADNVQIARQFVGAFDAVAELPGGETVRFRCQEWTDQTTLRDAARGIEVVHSTPRFDVVPVRFETYLKKKPKPPPNDMNPFLPNLFSEPVTGLFHKLRQRCGCTLVAQGSQPAVSPTSQSAGRGFLRARRKLGNLRDSRLGSLRYASAYELVRLSVLLFFSLWATLQFPALAATVKTITVEKSATVKSGEEGAEAEEDKSPGEPRVIIKSIELPDGEEGERKDLPWLGVSANEAGEALTAQLDLDPGVGLVVTYVAPDSPAAKAGLQKHDVLVELQDQSLVLPAQLRKLVRARKEGDTVKLKFYRAGKPQTVSATLAKSPPGFRAVDGEEGSLRDLHLRLLGAPSGKELELQMESLKGMLGNLKIDQKKIQEEVRRSVEKARKSFQDALKQMDKSTSASEASRQALEELARSGVLLDNKATVTVRSNDKSVKNLMKTDDSGTIVIVANPKLHLTAHDRDGKLLFDGAIETDEQRAKVPKEVWEKVEPMLAQLNAKPEE